MNKERLEMLFQNEEFIQRIENAKSIEEISGVLLEYGIEMTVDEVKEALIQGCDIELDADMLENVTGGAGWWYKINPAYWIFRRISEKIFGC